MDTRPRVRSVWDLLRVKARASSTRLIYSAFARMASKPAQELVRAPKCASIFAGDTNLNRYRPAETGSCVESTEFDKGARFYFHT